MSNQNDIYNLKTVYIVYFNLCVIFLEISTKKVYFIAVYYFIFKNNILVGLQYN